MNQIYLIILITSLIGCARAESIDTNTNVNPDMTNVSKNREELPPSTVCVENCVVPDLTEPIIEADMAQSPSIDMTVVDMIVVEVKDMSNTLSNSDMSDPMDSTDMCSNLPGYSEKRCSPPPRCASEGNCHHDKSHHEHP